MAKNCWRWNLGLASCLLMCGVSGFKGNAAKAQLKPDTTLPVNSMVTLQGKNSIITGGTRAGNNLFHSFEQFSVPTGSTAFFNINNASSIQNIITRVTGGSVSNINGILQANGTANLFLLNPNGIIFGAGAQLNIGGSFVGTTSNALGFGSQGVFSAVTPNNPSVLTVNPSALFFNQLAAANSVTTNQTTLQVPNGNSLLLVGGNVQINGGQLLAPGGRVELGAVAGSGSISLGGEGNNLSSSFPLEVLRGDVLLSKGAAVNVRAGGGGSIAINARNLDMWGGSKLRAGIASDMGSVNSQAGDVKINATGAVNLSEQSFIANVVQGGATGKAGNIIIEADSLKFTDASNLITSTLGQGDGGSVTLNIQNQASFDESKPKTELFFAGGIWSNVAEGAIGNAGTINLTAGSLTLTNGALFTTSTHGRGNGGNVNIKVRSSVSLSGESKDYYSGGIYSAVNMDSYGKGGTIDITAGSLSITNGSQIYTGTYGYGGAGSLNINVEGTVFLGGVGPDGYSSGIYNRVESTGVGQKGKIDINANSLVVTDGAVVTSSTDGMGDAGIINITARDRIVLDGVGLFSQYIKFKSSSGIYSSVKDYGVGQGGNIFITAKSLFITNGAIVVASTLNQGNGGNIQVNAERVYLDGFGSNGQSSGLFTPTEPQANGQAGEIKVNTDILQVADGALISSITLNASKGGNIIINAHQFAAMNGGQVVTTTSSSGKAGNINFHVDGNIMLSGSARNYGNRPILYRLDRNENLVRDIVGSQGAASGLFVNTDPNSTGAGGNLAVATGQLQVLDGAKFEASALGKGAAGNLGINASSILVNKANLSANTTAGDGGNINVQAPNIQLRHNSNITTNASGTANGGNITLNTNTLVALENSDIRANAIRGQGGNIQVKAPGIFRSLDSAIDASSQLGINGVVKINTIDNPTRSIAALKAKIEAQNYIVFTGCIATGKPAEGKFSITGSGGLPSTPGEALSSNPVLDDLGTTGTSATNSQLTSMVEAQALVKTPDGRFLLIASMPNSCH